MHCFFIQYFYKVCGGLAISNCRISRETETPRANPILSLGVIPPLLFLLFRAHPRRWSEEEDELLRMAVEKHDGVSSLD